MPQHGIDMAGDLRPVLGTDIAPAPEIVGRGIVGRALPGLDFSEDLDRGGDLRARGQQAPVGLVPNPGPPVTPSLVRVRGERERFAAPAA